MDEYYWLESCKNCKGKACWKDLRKNGISSLFGLRFFCLPVRSYIISLIYFHSIPLSTSAFSVSLPCFFLSHTLAAIYKGKPKFCASQHKRWMNDLLFLCDFIPCVLWALWVYRHCVCMFVWDMMQTEQAVFLLDCVFDVLSKNHHTNIQMHTFSFSISHCARSISRPCSNGIHWHQTQGLYCRNKSSSWKQHEIVAEKKMTNMTFWANVKTTHADLIPYLHLKDYSSFKHKLMMHGLISISSKCLQKMFHL